ncbi:hypothetical protein F4780DRAFT_753212 [Xylariomycetidae sp. FL0641]|nr:hypothetical protein F4780DRAFT_753212 [Xylariomycetidae sp. FL0641]
MAASHGPDGADGNGNGNGDGDGLKIINASFFGMGTKSMAHAYTILGYKTQHAHFQPVLETPWDLLEAAAEATWPSQPGARAPPHTRADWDALWGNAYEAVTDLAGPFAPQLIAAYPGARVVLVQRPFEAWWPSFRAGVRESRALLADDEPHAAATSSAFPGGAPRRPRRPVHATRKLLLGFLGVASREDLDEACARRAYDAYFARVRALVPDPGRLLVYRLGHDGWAPLCAFLGVDVPDAPFPRAADDDDALTPETRDVERRCLLGTVKATGPWILGAASVGFAWWSFRRKLAFKLDLNLANLAM